MKKITILLLSLFVKNASAQIDIPTLFNSNAELENSFYNPSTIGSEYKSLKVSLLPIYMNAGTNFISAGDLVNYYKGFKKSGESQTASNSAINAIMSNLRNTNTIFVGTDITLLNVGLNINVKRKKILELGFGVREHIHASFSFNRELPELMYKGNKYYEGQTVDVLPKLNALQYTDYSIVAAKTFNVKLYSTMKPIMVKPAIRLRYLVGNANINMEDNTLSFYTAPDGRYLEAKLDGAFKASGLNEFNNETFDGKTITDALFKGNGRGVGFDLGASVKPLDRLEASFSLFDNGHIKFTKDAYSISSNKTVRWEGYDINNNIDSFFNDEDLLDLDSNETSYKVNIGSKLMLTANYGLGKKLYAKRRAYYPHNFRILYLQGFKNYLNTTTNPLLSLGYSFVYQRTLDIGLNANVGGLNKASIGGHLHLSFGPFQIGFASNSLGGFVSRYSTRALDFKLYTALCF